MKIDEDTVKPWIVSNSSSEFSTRWDDISKKFNLISERGLAVWVELDAECHVITTEPMVLEIRFDRGVLWITSRFPERIMLANQSFTVFWDWFHYGI